MLPIEVAGRFAREAAAFGEGEVCALLRGSFYLRFPRGGFACVGDGTLGRGPLNALARDFRRPRLGERVALAMEGAFAWQPAQAELRVARRALARLERSARGRAPGGGLGCLVAGQHNALSAHAAPALEALERWLRGTPLEEDVAGLIGLGAGVTPPGDDFLAGALVALRAFGQPSRADALWRWLGPRLAGRTGLLSAAQLAAAAAGEAHEALHACLATLGAADADWREPLERIDAVGHSSGWDALAGATAVARSA